MEQYTEKCDVYSFAILLTEMATRNRPYAGLAPSVVLAGVSGGTLRPSLPEGVPPAIAALAAACWSHDPQRRPGFTAVLAALSSPQVLRAAAAGGGTPAFSGHVQLGRAAALPRGRRRSAAHGNPAVGGGSAPASL